MLATPYPRSLAAFQPPKGTWLQVSLPKVTTEARAMGALWWNALHPDFATKEGFFFFWGGVNLTYLEQSSVGAGNRQLHAAMAASDPPAAAEGYPTGTSKYPHFCSWEIQGSFHLLPAEIWHVWTQTKSRVCLGKAPVLTTAILLAANFIFYLLLPLILPHSWPLFSVSFTPSCPAWMQTISFLRLKSAPWHFSIKLLAQWEP